MKIVLVQELENASKTDEWVETCSKFTSKEVRWSTEHNAASLGQQLMHILLVCFLSDVSSPSTPEGCKGKQRKHSIHPKVLSFINAIQDYNSAKMFEL